MSKNVTNERKRKLGFKVSDHEHNILQQYANIFDQQDIEDSNTKQRRKLLPSCFKVKLFYLFLSNLFFYDN
jgi:hypothetical protein